MTNAFPGAALGTRQSPAGGVAAVDSGTVLLVDDEEGVRAVTSVLLRRRGFRVVEAEHGSDGLALYVANPTMFTLMLVDLSMPHMDGAAFLTAVRALNSKQPIIAISGHDWKDARKLIGSQPIDGYLQKPFTPEQLYEAIAKALGPVSQS
ncbi:MAG: response regulator [Gemmatimonadaceae bacterium]|nr:response regulator [Gemmatimonadaceae bacterium]